MAVTAKFEIRGLSGMLDKMKQLEEKGLEAADRAVLRELEGVATDAKKITPVDIGVLRNTIHARRGEVSRSSIKHMVVAGPMPSDAIDTGPANEYAIVVHENPDAHHEEGDYKYLERALDAHVSEAGKNIAEDIKEELGI